MDGVYSNKCLSENGSHKLMGGDSIDTEHVGSIKLPSNVVNVTIEGK